MLTVCVPGPGLGLTVGQEGGLSSFPFCLAPSAAAATAGTVGRGFSLPPVPALAQPPTDPLSR